MSKLLPALFTILTITLGNLPTQLSFATAPTSDPTATIPTSDSTTAVPTSDSTTTPASDPTATIPTSDSTISHFDLLAANLYIKSVNPGFKINDLAETGEAIELANSGDITLPLANVSLRYRNDKNTPYLIYAFDDNASMVAETILLRYEKSPEVKSATVDLDESDNSANPDASTNSSTLAKVADDTYTKTLAMSGSLELVYNADTDDEQIIGSLCWTGKTDCSAKFTSSTPGSLVFDENTKTYEFQADYAPTFSGGLYLPPAEEPAASEDSPDQSSADPATTNDSTSSTQPQCQDLEFNEILSYYDESTTEQFIEFYNPTDEIIPLSGCQLRYKKKLYDLVATNSATENSSLSEITPSEFYVYRTSAFTLTKNPNTSNLLELVNITGDTVAELSYPHGQKKGTAYALINNAWQTTYLPTPGSMNLFQEFKTCPLGKVINEATGNCVKVDATTNSVTPCPAGKYRNPATGRCKNIEDSSSATKTCKEGYELNPETNRCRKIKSNDGADYALVPITGDPEKSSFVAIWALIAVAALGLAYVIFQFRREIIYFFRRLLAKLKH